MEIQYVLSFDKLPEYDNNPLVFIIQTLWNKGIEEIFRYTESTLEFRIEGKTEDEIETKAEAIVNEVNKVSYVRLAKSMNIIGHGNSKSDSKLQEFITNNINAGTLKRLQ